MAATKRKTKASTRPGAKGSRPKVARKAKAKPVGKARPRTKVATAGERAGAAAIPANGSISIRMYNVGFGDAFLVTIPTVQGARRVLFDCGSIAAGPRKIAEVAKQIVEDCKDASGIPTIDVVVATHRHKDHVSGFSNKVWDQVRVQEVWMPWTEHPRDVLARRIRETQSGLCLALAAGLSISGPSLTQLADQDDGPSERLDPVRELTLNALSNETAMATLHSGFSGNPLRRFLPGSGDTDDSRSFRTAALPGVAIHVLGPSRDENVIRDMDPESGGAYLRMSEEANRAPEDACRPFGDEFEHAAVPNISDVFFPDDPDKIMSGPTASDLEVAVALDKAVNGTSLVIVLEVRGKYLLFPGDAQWGTWQAIFADAEWREMLCKTDFYKIGHHGSHNATPKEFVEDVIHEHVVAMASTLPRSQWPDIPRAPLLAALRRRKSEVARSDQEGALRGSRTFTVSKDGYIETQIPV